MTSSLLGDAFAHHIWATERLIDECSALNPEQLATPAAGTYGSILDTLRHLVSSEGWYLSFFRDGITQIDEKADTTLAELRSAMTGYGAGWMNLLASVVDPGREIVEHDDGWQVHSPVGLRLAQVVHHGTDHRSHVCTVLTTLGVTPPEIDLWAFARATGRERAVRVPA